MSNYDPFNGKPAPQLYGRTNPLASYRKPGCPENDLAHQAVRIVNKLKEDLTNPLVGASLVGYLESLSVRGALDDIYRRFENVGDALDNKVDKIPGWGLSEENFSLIEKNKLASLENFDDSAIQAELSGKVVTTDPRLSDPRTPTGTAGGVLSGTYPNPAFAVDMATQAELDAAVALRVPLTQKGAPSGVATLDAGGHVPMTQVSVDVMRVSAVVDNLTSTATDRPLSANQGRVLKQLVDQLQTILDSDDTDLDEIQEIVNYIKQNREDLQNLSVENIAGLVDALAGKADTSGDYANLRARATTAADVGLGAVDNTADADKPVSTAQASAIAAAQAHAVQRANHTGEQPISSVTGLQTALADIDTMTIYGAYRA